MIFLILGEVRPFCILGQNLPANKARNRPCSISRAERFTHWPKFFATFRKYKLLGTSALFNWTVLCKLCVADWLDKVHIRTRSFQFWALACSSFSCAFLLNKL